MPHVHWKGAVEENYSIGNKYGKRSIPEESQDTTEDDCDDEDIEKRDLSDLKNDGTTQFFVGTSDNDLNSGDALNDHLKRRGLFKTRKGALNARDDYEETEDEEEEVEPTEQADMYSG